MSIRRTGGRKKQAVIYRHQELYHENGDFDFEVSILSKCFGKPSRRMITEAVTIGEIDEEKSIFI